MTNSTNKQKKVYHHLTQNQRDRIAVLYSKGVKQYKIAEKVGVTPPTISRELKRNSQERFNQDYFPSNAHQLYSDRKSKAAMKERVPDPKLRRKIKWLLKKGWSPEQIAGHINKRCPGMHTNHETIYQYIYYEDISLVQYLPKAHRKRQKRAVKKGKRAIKILNRVMIDQRPDVINNKKRYSDWEADTAVSRKSKTALVVIRERKSQHVKIRKIESKTAANTSKAIISMMQGVPEKLRKSITFDNGTENAYHELIAKELNVKTYFCRPYHSWEKGGVENTIGLIRRYFPKKTDLALISNAQIRYIENQLNNRPRKSLGFKTPNQVFLNCTY